MQIRVFTLRALDADDHGVEDLNAFLRSHRIASVERQFVADGANSFWSVCVTFTEGGSNPTPSNRADGSKKRIDYREVLNEHDFAVFAKLRTLRKALADREGIPAYALFTNDQLAEIVKRNVASKKALGEINGVGEARVEKYGTQFLEALQQANGEFAKLKGNDAEAKPNHP